MLINYRNTYFFTASINNWIPLLKLDDYKKVVIETLAFPVAEKRIKVYAFVIMPNHIHLIWHIPEEFQGNLSQGSLLRFTSNKFKKILEKENPILLEKFKVSLKDRQFQFWQRNPLSIEIFKKTVFQQKLDYIHSNPIQQKWNFVENRSNYLYSSAYFYETGVDKFGFLSNINEE